MGGIVSKMWSTDGSKFGLHDVVYLPNSVAMPRLGFGVWQVPQEVCEKVCEMALEAGYRHIDTAQVYRNEEEAGLAVAKSKLKLRRKDVFITTKIAVDHGSVERNYESMMESVKRINGEHGNEKDAYADLFLIHSPRMGPEAIKRVWTALERMLKEGKARSIGVSNFEVPDIQHMKEYAKIWPPHVNQIELNPWVQERPLVKYCEEMGIVIEAYSPLATGKRLDDPVVGEVAKKYNKSPAQVLIRYCLQKGWVPLAKSVHKDRINENTHIFDFHISKEDMATLDGLDGK